MYEYALFKLGQPDELIDTGHLMAFVVQHGPSMLLPKLYDQMQIWIIKSQAVFPQ